MTLASGADGKRPEINEPASVFGTVLIRSRGKYTCIQLCDVYCSDLRRGHSANTTFSEAEDLGELMRTLSRRRRHTAILILFIALSSPAITTTTAFAAGTAPADTLQGWVYYATYPSPTACDEAGLADPTGRAYQCVVSTRPGAFDLYFMG